MKFKPARLLYFYKNSTNCKYMIKMSNMSNLTNIYIYYNIDDNFGVSIDLSILSKNQSI